MVVVLYLLAVALIALGATGLGVGSDPRMLSFGNTLMIVGAVGVGAGVVTLALAVVVGRLGDLSDRFADMERSLAGLTRPGLGAPYAVEMGSGETSREPPPVHRAPTDPVEPTIAPPAPVSRGPAVPTGAMAAGAGVAAGALAIGAAGAAAASSFTRSPSPEPAPVFAEPVAVDPVVVEPPVVEPVVLVEAPAVEPPPPEPPAIETAEIAPETSLAFDVPEPTLSPPPDIMAALEAEMARIAPSPVAEPVEPEAMAAEPEAAEAPAAEPTLDLAALEAALLGAPEPADEPAEEPREEPAEAAEASIEDALFEPIEPDPPAPVVAEPAAPIAVEPAPADATPADEIPAMSALARDFPELGDILTRPTQAQFQTFAPEPFAEPVAQTPPEPPAAPEPPPRLPPAPRLELPPAPLLREGTIAGVGFRLYGDGSIEADLPDGPTKFSSLREFRAHIGG